MKLNYIVPENKSDLSISQWVRIQELQTLAELHEEEVNIYELIAICLKLTVSQVKSLPLEEINFADENIAKALESDAVFVSRFEYKGFPFGFIPDLEAISGGDYAVVHNLLNDPEANPLDFIKILYRRVTEEKDYSVWWSKEVIKRYSIEPYNEEIDSDYFKDVPYSVYEGARVFFYSLGNELKACTQKYITAQTEESQSKKPYSLVKNGSGLILSTPTQYLQELRRKTLTRNLCIKYSID